MTEKPFNITPPNNEQIWACLQRCLSFEDPGSRWERLQNLVLKQLHDGAFKEKDVPDWALPYQDYLFGLVYGFNGKTQSDPDFVKACRLLNVMLALADIRRFTEIAFDSWKVSLPKVSNKELARAFPQAADDPELAELALRLQLTDAQATWLQHAARAVPDWSLLLDHGPWQSDPRPPFLANVLGSFVEMSQDIAAIFEAGEKFDKALLEHRHVLPGSFLPNLILLVEGETESVLLPHFASLLGTDFSSLGVMLQSAGGAKQVARRYFELRDLVQLPIVLLVDADAGEEIEVASEALRDNDRLHIWRAGDIEDTFDAATLVQLLNVFLQQQGVSGTVSPNDFPGEHRRTVILNRLWRARGLGNFDKIGFAEVVASNLCDQNQVPADVKKAIRTVEELLQSSQQKQKKQA